MRLGSLTNENEPSKTHQHKLVELTRVQPIEAEIIVARLRAAGIAATAGADSVYPSVTIADGVPVFVVEDDLARASSLLQGDDQPE